jgi:hypothetical protein
MSVASPSQRLLRKALLANAGFSLLSAVIIVGWQHQLVRLLGIPPRFNPISLAFALTLSPFGGSSVLWRRSYSSNRRTNASGMNCLGRRPLRCKHNNCSGWGAGSVESDFSGSCRWIGAKTYRRQCGERSSQLRRERKPSWRFATRWEVLS